MAKALLTLTFTLTLVLLSTQCLSQAYTSALGLRVGYPVAASYKKYFTEGSAFEVYGGFRRQSSISWTSLSAAYLSSYSLGIEGPLAPLSWYWGAGGSVYHFRFRDSFFGGLISQSDLTITLFGVNAYLGLEYAFEDIPIVVTADWVPTYLFSSEFVGGFTGEQGGVGIRYILK